MKKMQRFFLGLVILTIALAAGVAVYAQTPAPGSYSSFCSRC